MHRIRYAGFLAATFAVLLFRLPPAGAGPLIVEKNLFSPDRKPSDEEPIKPPPGVVRQNLPAKAVQLDGIIIHGDSRKAIVRVKGQVPSQPGTKSHPTSPFQTIREGDMIGDIRVTKIEAKSITLEKDGETSVISLFTEGKLSTPAAGAAAQTPQMPPSVQPPGPMGAGQRAQQQAGGNRQPGNLPAPGGDGSGAPGINQLVPAGVNADQGNPVEQEESSGEGAEQSDNGGGEE